MNEAGPSDFLTQCGETHKFYKETPTPPNAISSSENNDVTCSINVSLSQYSQNLSNIHLVLVLYAMC